MLHLLLSWCLWGLFRWSGAKPSFEKKFLIDYKCLTIYINIHFTYILNIGQKYNYLCDPMQQSTTSFPSNSVTFHRMTMAIGCLHVREYVSCCLIQLKQNICKTFHWINFSWACLILLKTFLHLPYSMCQLQEEHSKGTLHY